jgi:hypothetical protein
MEETGIPREIESLTRENLKSIFAEMVDALAEENLEQLRSPHISGEQKLALVFEYAAPYLGFTHAFLVDCALKNNPNQRMNKKRASECTSCGDFFCKSHHMDNCSNCGGKLKNT